MTRRPVALSEAVLVVGSRAGDMIDGSAASSARAREELEKPGLHDRLVRVAFWSTRDLERARDLVSDTIARVLDPDGLPWDGRGSFASFMALSMHHVHDDQQRRRSAHEIARDAAVIGKITRSALPLAEELIDEKRDLERMTMLHQRLLSLLEKEDPALRRCFEMKVDQASSEEQAAKLGWTIEQVYEAHRTIGRRARRLHDEWTAEQDDRLRILRQGAAARNEAGG